MNNKTDLLNDIEERLGNTGSRAQAESMAVVLARHGYISFDGTEGYSLNLPDWNDGGNAWNALLAEAEVSE